METRGEKGILQPSASENLEPSAVLSKADVPWKRAKAILEPEADNSLKPEIAKGIDKIHMSRITSPMWDGIMDAFHGVAVDILRFDHINFCPLAAADVGRLTTLKLCTELYVSNSLLLSKHITDELLQKLSRKGLSKVMFGGSVPADKSQFEASDDGVIALCFPDEQPGSGVRFLLDNFGLSDAFFAKFLQHCHAVPEDRRAVQCLVQPLPSDTERQIMALYPIRHVSANGNVTFFFEGAECVFMMDLSNVPKSLYCQYN